MTDQKIIEIISVQVLTIDYYTKDTTKKDFLKNQILQDAISYRLSVMGHLINKLSELLYEKLPKIIQLNFAFGFDRIELIPVGEELWDFLFHEFGLITKMDELFNFYENEFKTELSFHKSKIDNKSTTKKISIDYKDPIHTKSSIWTVKKR